MHYPDTNLPPYLIVDDSEDDVFLLRHRLREGEIANPIHTFSSPPGALAFLRACRTPEELPAVVFTDIRMPVQCGLALIASIRKNPEWHAIRVVVITSSNATLDLERAIDAGANAYLIKFPPSRILAEFLRDGPWFEAHRLAGVAASA